MSAPAALEERILYGWQPREEVTYTAACPSCGQDATWTSQLWAAKEQRVVVAVTCGCQGAVDASGPPSAPSAA